MNGEIKEEHKLVVDGIFKNNFDRAQAYVDVYECSLHSARSAVCTMLKRPEVKRYYDEQMEYFKQETTLSKEKILTGLESHIKLFDSMVELAQKDELTKAEAQKLKRLNDMLKASDVLKAKDMLCRITGAYEPDKLQVEQITYKIDFGK